MTEYLKIIEDKGKYGNTGKFDFRVCASVCNFTPKEMEAFRSMVVVALRVADNMWAAEQEKKQSTCSQQIGEQ